MYAHPEGCTQVCLCHTCGKTTYVDVVVKSGPQMGCKAITDRHELHHVIT